LLRVDSVKQELRNYSALQSDSFVKLNEIKPSGK